MVVGLYLSLTRLNLFVSWLLTWIVAFVLPSFAIVIIGAYMHVAPIFGMLVSAVIQLSLAVSVLVLA